MLNRRPNPDSKANYNSNHNAFDCMMSASKQNLLEIDARIYGYKRNILKTLFFYALSVMTLGLLYLIGKVWPKFELGLVYSKCPLKDATVVLVKDINGTHTVCNVHQVLLDISSDDIPQREISDEEMLKIRQVNEQSPATPSTSFSSTDSSDANSDNELLRLKGPKKSHKLGYIFNSVSRNELEYRAEELASLPTNNSTPVSTVRYFEYHQEKFVLNETLNLFYSLNGLENVTCQDIVEMEGNTETQANELTKIYGSNSIGVVVKNYCQLFFDEARNPFYMFQLGSIAVWSLDEYYLYAICVCIIVFGTIVASILETKQQMTMLKEMAEGKGEILVNIQRPNGDVDGVMASELVPGDIILIPSEGFAMPCDAVVTRGTCIVNESMLTGESIPVHKTALISSTEIYDTETFKRNTLFCGTQVIQTRHFGGEKAACVVVRTGFSTAKGSLIRSIIFPKHVSFSFRTDAKKFVGILFGIAFLSMIYTSIQYIYRHASPFVMIIRVLDTLTIAVPPALPAALSIGSYYAQIRLKLKNIFCTSPDRINFAGKIKLFCFDKTGTLTESGLDMWCVVPYNTERQIFQKPMTDPDQLPLDSNLLRGMASCHSLTYIQGELIGDPLDLKMFESTKWELEEPYMYQNGRSQRNETPVPTVVKKNGVEIGILRQFEFTPHLQRMSVIVREVGNPQELELFCKGSPEKVLPLCVNAPTHYEAILDSFTIKGYRVLALASRKIGNLQWNQLQRISRSEVETELIFYGFIVMQNCLKPATRPVINKLIKGGIRSVMVTGDNMLTAVSVARECNMISPDDKTIIVDVNNNNELEFRLTMDNYDEQSIRADFQPESNYHGLSKEEAHIEIQVDDDPDYDEDGNQNGAYESSLEDTTESDVLDEVAFLHRCRTESTSAANLDAYMKMTRNSSAITLTGDTFLDMNNHLVQMPSTAAIISNEDREYQNSGMRQSRKLSVTTAGIFQQLSNANYHFAMTGKAWAHIYQSCSKEVLNKILVKGTVFARMNPENKRQLVESFQGIGYCVGMCGDGANDCAALKMAHVGVSLSDAEASVAAPFTSKVCDISCVETLVLEGRCALVTSFAMFKYMALYSMVQLCTVLILYTKGTNLADPQFLFIDLGIITTLAVAMGRTHSSTKLVNQRPMAKLLSVQNFVSIIFQIMLAASCQIFGLFFLQSQSWFVPVKLENPDEKVDNCWETSTLFYISCFQYIALSLAFSKGKPFRKPFYTNWWLVSVYVTCSVFSLMLILAPLPPLQQFFHLIPWKFDETFEFRLKLLAFPIINLVASISFERLVDNRNYLKKILRKLGWTKKKFEYEEVEGQIESDLSWPPIKPA